MGRGGGRHPNGHAVPAAAGPVAQRDRREQRRHRRRGRHGAADGIAVEVGAQQVEALLRELEARRDADVGGVEDQEGPLPRAVEVRELRAAEQLAVEVIGVDIAAGVLARRQPHPVARIEEHRALQAARYIARQEAPPEIGEQPVAVQRPVGRSHGAARDGGDEVDLVEQTARAGAVGRPDTVLGELLQHAVRERRCAHAAAREAHHHPQIVGRATRQHRRGAIAVRARRTRERLAEERTRRRAARQQRQRDEAYGSRAGARRFSAAAERACGVHCGTDSRRGRRSRRP